MQTLTNEASSASENNKTETQTNPEPQLPVAVGFGSDEPKTDANLSSSPSKEVQQADAKKPEPKSMLKAVTKAVETQKVATVSESSTTQKVVTENPGDDAAKADDSQDDSKLPFHNHPRWKEVQQQSAAFKERAERFDLINNFLTQSSISGDEFAEGVDLMRALKNDPVNALKRLEPIIANLRRFTGEILPDDLSQKVDLGQIDEVTARQIAKERNELAFNTRAANDRLDAVQRQQVAHQQQQHTAVLQDSVTRWEEVAQKRDPDYAEKAPFVLDRFKLLIAATPPRDSKEAIDLAERALSEVNEKMKGFSARRQPLRSVTSQSSTATAATQAPRTLLEAAQAALRK